MTLQHPSQFLFSSSHPFTTEFDVEFLSYVKGELSVSVETSAKYADAGAPTEAHTSFSSLVLDTAMGCCVLGELETFVPIATLSLNINHHRRPKMGERLICRAVYHGRSGDVSNVTAEMTGNLDNSIVATGIGTFMIGTRSRPVGSKPHQTPKGEAA